MDMSKSETWDRMSKFYDNSWAGFQCNKVVPKIVELAKITENDKVLEIGAGTGSLTSYLCKNFNGLDLTATDLSNDMCKVLEKVIFKIELKYRNFLMKKT